ncbi:hypothetical protein PPL_05041 [Heterostelium album PN500]|uniref:CHK kinase-like domain-containing protein n=1 Tax=Heterostelium pallidum (strain ATCC 26659 / Pp 5 / PN500) TaxID=670386 RepID=D3B997_HETP5|nr:hypothetical protein PPL_05041 [Heterostelium album PN500]EFA82136.1 hypothetical protein PPL_05041 [Heterostelium album PN500]|eukprot:XP_020434253.1 hypothetical protein PPL_05041 [Heterostelium album PN500]
MDYYKTLAGYYISKNIRYLKSFTPLTLEVVTQNDFTVSWLEWAMNGESKSFKSYRLTGFELNDKVTGGFVSDITRVNLTWELRAGQQPASQAPPSTVLVKCIKQDFYNFRIAQTMAFHREAWFFLNWHKLDLGIDLMPRCYHASISKDSTNFIILMEDLGNGKAYNGSVLLGNQCWGEPKEELPPHLRRFTFDSIAMLEEIFVKMADFHSKTWRRASLLDVPELNFAKWLKGEDRSQWELGISTIRKLWANLKQSKTASQMSKVLVETMDKALANTNWEKFQGQFNINLNPTLPYCLIHGDFHGANLLWNPEPAVHRKSSYNNDEAEEVNQQPTNSSDKPPFYLVDWAGVGVFCPFTDLAQFVISNVEISYRQMNEERILRLYWNKLISNGVINARDYPFHKCYERYILGGTERWLQMFTLMAPSIPDFAVEYFHNQVASFIVDHKDIIDENELALMSSYPLVEFQVDLK